MGLGSLWKLYQVYRRIKSNMKILSWKKILATFIAILIQTLGKELKLTDEQINWISGIIIAFILGQGIADFGKGAEIVKAKLAEFAAKGGK